MFSEQIKTGIALLDSAKPGWEEKIRLYRLDIGSCRECILGQVYGGYIRGRTVLGLGYFESVRYGFTPPEAKNPEWWRNKQILTMEWIDAIKTRRKE